MVNLDFYYGGENASKIKELLQACLAAKPEDRKEMEEILKLKFFQELEEDMFEIIE